ncbi:MAG: hypothetical protein IJR63_10975 [Synergistaceae bacterium]|nr:hypothetical protein [Synergistaceae bacterium]
MNILLSAMSVNVTLSSITAMNQHTPGNIASLPVMPVNMAVHLPLTMNNTITPGKHTLTITL